MPPLSTENSVLAQATGAEDYEEGNANELLEPGQGVVRGAGGFDAAGADAVTKRVVREQRNPGSRGIETDTSPLEQTYAAGDNVETIGFQSHGKARVLLAYADAQGTAGTDDTYTEGTEVGWNANGYLESTGGAAVTDAVGRIAQEESVTVTSTDDPVHVLVEFY